MWQLTVYEIIPWQPLQKVLGYGEFRTLVDCHFMNNVFNAALSEEAQMAGSYISMCIRML